MVFRIPSCPIRPYNGGVKTIAVINQKGGVGKTTTSANLGDAVSMRGMDVCLIDLDPQAHLSLHFGLEPANDTASVYDVLLGEATLSEAAERIRPTLCVLPTSTDLAGAEVELANRPQWQFSLRRGLDAAQTLPHRFVFIDCPPSLGLLTLNALTAADEVLIPLQPHFLAMQGLAKLLETIQSVHDHLNPRLRVRGVVLCMHETVTRLGRDVISEVSNFFNDPAHEGTPWAGASIFQTVIRRNIRLAECPSFGETIFQYDPRSNGATDYAALAEEFLGMYESDASAPAEPHDHPKSQPVHPPMPYPARQDASAESA